MRKAVITLPDSCKEDDKLILKRYQFVNRKMSIPILSDKSTDHDKVGSLLCRYYGCTMVVEEESAEEAQKAAAAKVEDDRAAELENEVSKAKADAATEERGKANAAKKAANKERAEATAANNAANNAAKGAS